MELSVVELFRRAKKVAKLYNGTYATRAEQLEAMKDLQDFIKAAEVSSPASSSNDATEA